MKYYCYILQGRSKGEFCVGSYTNPEVRLTRHNSGARPSTKSGRPRESLYKEEFDNKMMAIKRENRINK